jgi:EAL and modified HD-GYP domain-containing signal transduction protein
MESALAATDFTQPSHAAASQMIRRESICYQPTGEVIGHEVLLDNIDEAAPEDTALRCAQNELLLKNLVNSGQGIDKKLTFIRLEMASLQHPLLSDLDANKTVLAIQPDPNHADKLMARCRELKSAGFRLALDDFAYSPALYPLLGLADYVRFNISRKSILDTGPHLLDMPRLAGKTLIARNIHNEDDRKAASRLSFRHFQGRLFENSTHIQLPKSGLHLMRIVLLMNLVRNRAESSAIEVALKNESDIAGRLLKYINASASGPNETVLTISEAVTRIGHDGLHRWLCVILFGGLENQDTLLENATLRGRLTELFGQRLLSAENRSPLFVTGMLSYADKLFDTPLSTAIGNFSLSPLVEQALLLNGGSYSKFLKLAIACTDQDEEQVRIWAKKCDISPELVNTLYVKALVWVSQVER